MIMEYYFLMNVAISSLISLLFGKIVNAKWLLGMIFIPDSKSTTSGALSDVHSVRNGESDLIPKNPKSLNFTKSFNHVF